MFQKMTVINYGIEPIYRHRDSLDLTKKRYLILSISYIYRKYPVKLTNKKGGN